MTQYSGTIAIANPKHYNCSNRHRVPYAVRVWHHRDEGEEDENETHLPGIGVCPCCIAIYLSWTCCKRPGTSCTNGHNRRMIASFFFCPTLLSD